MGHFGAMRGRKCKKGLVTEKNKLTSLELYSEYQFSFIIFTKIFVGIL